MSKNKIHNILKPLSAIFALLSAVMCAFAFTYDYDKATGYFKDSTLTYLFYTTLTVCIILSIAAAITKNNSSEVPPRKDRRVMGIIMLFSFAFYFISYCLTPTPEYMTSGITKAITPVIFATALVSISHFAIIAFFANRTSDSAKIFTGIAPVILPTLVATASYFDMTQPLNSPYTLFLEFGLVVFAFYYVTELKEYTPVGRTKFSIAMAGISTALSLSAGVAVIFKILHNPGFNLLDISTAILLATMASCSASKLLETE